MEKSVQNTILSAAKKFSIENSLDNDIHGFKHVERVYELCIEIGKSVRANLFILRMAALLHDIGRIKENENRSINHAELSAEMALKFLKNIRSDLEKQEIENIIHSIKSHSFSNEVKPRTLEAKVLSDADKLDALGAIGLYRTIGFTVNNNGNFKDVLEHLENKILQLDQQLFLKKSKRIANRRLKVIKDFYNKGCELINKEKKFYRK